jgi:uncharacterized spore protein YtfJ
MEKKKVIISNPIAAAGITLILVIKLSVSCQPAGSSIVFSGVKQPISLVVTSASDKKAFDIEGREFPIDKLVQETPELARVLEIT